MLTRGRAARPGLAVLLMALAGLALPSGGAAAVNIDGRRVVELLSGGPGAQSPVASAGHLGSSEDGSRIFIQTDEALVPEDADAGGVDIYERSGGSFHLVSTGPTASTEPFFPVLEAVSANGDHVLFTTEERLVAADTDNSLDLYDRTGNQTVLVSTGPSSADTEFSVIFRDMSDDGTHVYFTTAEKLVPEDLDPEGVDLYERAGGTTRLVSTGPVDQQGIDFVILRGVTSNGGVAVFSTEARLVEGDDDGTESIYRWDDGVTSLVDVGPFNLDVSDDATRFTFRTSDPLLPGADTDAAQDLYQLVGSELRLISTGPTGGNAEVSASLEEVSEDGRHVVFSTVESLVATDIDATRDLYESHEGQTSLVSTSDTAGNGDFTADLNDVSADGTSIVFETAEQLDPADDDGEYDQYQRKDGTTTLLTDGTGDFLPAFRGQSDDGSRVFFTTAAALSVTDADDRPDIYQATGANTSLVTPGNGDFEPDLVEISPDGARVYFDTDEALVPDDTDQNWDAYVSRVAPPAAGSAPVVGGSPVVGATLTCSPGTWVDAESFAYRWHRDGAVIAGAASATYTVTTGDAGRQLTCTVTATNDGGSTSATSASVSVPAVPAGPGPGAGPLAGPCANKQTGGAGPDKLLGTAFGDRLLGLRGADVLRGLDRADCLVGGPGPDRLTGGRGADLLQGSRGKDQLSGGARADVLRGGSGEDLIRGGRGTDKLFGGAGDDVVRALDHRAETVRCGSGVDEVTADQSDTLISCEIVFSN